MSKEIIELKNTLIVWAVEREFIDLATLLNGEQTLPDLLNKCILRDGDLLAERENQIRIQKEKLGLDKTDSEIEERKIKIGIIETQRNAVNTRLKFYSETLESIK